MDSIFELGALELGEKIKNGEIGAVEAAEAVLDKIEAEDENYNAFITVTRKEALMQAEAVQKRIISGEKLSPLAGVPCAVKDIICTKGVKTTCASKILDDFKPVYDATVIDRLNAAGAVITGKLNMDEFAMGSTNETSFYGPVKNPWNYSRVPGGSSGGSAAAVSSGEVFYALGTDTGGSIRQPASYCGVTGIKPTYGSVSRYGLIAYASSLDQIGPIGKSAADCAAVLDLICGKDPKDSTSLDLNRGPLSEAVGGSIKGMKIGLPEDCFGEGLDDEVRKSVLGVADVLKSLGAEIGYFPMNVIKYAVPTYYIIACAEASSNLSRFDGVKYGFRADNYEDMVSLHTNTRSEGFGMEVKRRILIGTFALSTGYYDAYYKKALQVKALIKKAFDDAFKKYDMILCPTAPSAAPAIGESLKDPLKMYLSDIYTVSVNLAGLPGISMPCGFDRNGMPIGAQLIGRALGEADILKAADRYQSVTDYHKKRPQKGGALR